MYDPYWVVLYDFDEGYASFNKTFPVGKDGKEAAKAKAEKEAERLKRIGYYVYDIQYCDPAARFNAEWDEDEE